MEKSRYLAAQKQQVLPFFFVNHRVVFVEIEALSIAPRSYYITSSSERAFTLRPVTVMWSTMLFTYESMIFLYLNKHNSFSLYLTKVRNFII